MKSIRLKLAALLNFVVFAVLLAVFLSQVVFLPSYYQDAKTKQIKSLAQAVETQLLQGEIADETLSSDASAYEAVIEIYNAGGSLLQTTTEIAGRGMGMGMGMSMNPYLMRGQYQQYLSSFFNSANDSMLETVEQSRTNQKILFYALRSEDDYVIAVTTPVTPLTSVLKILQGQLSFILIAALLGAILFSLLLSGLFIRPIINLSRAAARISEGQLSVRVFNPSRDEVGGLTQDFNQMVERLAEAEQMKRDILANVSHDLKTPLTMIQGYAQSLVDTACSDREKTQQHLSIIQSEAQRLEVLVGDILELTKLQTGEIRLQLKDFDIRELSLKTIERFNLLREQGYRIQLSCSDVDCYMVNADPIRIEQVLYNLIGNAINYTGDDKTVTLSLEKVESDIIITVSDTGNGIPDTEIPRIWERYYSGINSGRRLLSGTGLGLSIVKKILDAHSAAVGVDSTVGLGSNFWFKLKKIKI